MKNALRVGLIYLVLSALWIYFSDVTINRLVTDPEAIRRLQTWKGWGFVLASSALIVYLVRRELVRVRESGDRFRALVEQSLAGVYLIRHGRFLYVNPKLASVFGYDPGEMVASVGVMDVVAKEDRDVVRGNLSLREAGEVEERHYRFTGVRSDGERIRVEVHGRSVTWEGEPAVVGVLLDVGETERIEARTREAQKLESLGTLTGQIAHDFNNFLTAIIGPLDLCLEQLHSNDEMRPELEEVRSSAERAGSLSRKLLAFSRNRPTIPRALDLNELLGEMVPLVDRLVGGAMDVRLELGPAPCVVEIDPSDVEQVVMNLVVNAREAIEGQGSVTIRTGGSEGSGTGTPEGSSPGNVWLEVEDDGTGMSEATRESIFEPFFTTKPTGTGLGLSTVFGIVTQAGGSVDVRSEEGKGTCFRILLPGTREVPEALLTHGREAGAHRPIGAGETVLVVEDEESVRRTVARALERFGYRVLEAGDGETALSRAASPGVQVDLLLIDVQLPDGLGPDIAERISRLHPAAGVLYASGYSDQDVTRRITAAPAARLLEKPFGIETLLREVRNALDGRGEKRGSNRAV